MEPNITLARYAKRFWLVSSITFAFAFVFGLMLIIRVTIAGNVSYFSWLCGSIAFVIVMALVNGHFAIRTQSAYWHAIEEIKKEFTEQFSDPSFTIAFILANVPDMRFLEAKTETLRTRLRVMYDYLRSKGVDAVEGSPSLLLWIDHKSLRPYDIKLILETLERLVEPIEADITRAEQRHRDVWNSVRI